MSAATYGQPHPSHASSADSSSIPDDPHVSSPLVRSAVSVSEMTRIDAEAIERIGIPRLLLMEHAGLAVARAVQRLAPSSMPVGICCGSGFNGGDGLSAARHLHAWKYPVTLMLVGSISRLRAEPAIYAHVLQQLGLSIVEVTAPARAQDLERLLRHCGLIVDALLGIGSREAVREPLATLIAAINRLGKPVVAVDMPSGIDGDTGAVQGVAVKATLTVALGRPKQGCFRQEGPAHAGTVVVEPITIPETVLNAPAY